MAQQPPPYPGQNPPAYPDTKGAYPPPQPAYPQQPGYPPQQPGYPQQPYPQPGGTTTTIIQQPGAVVIAPVAFREFPVSMQCPSCRASIVTGTSYVTGTLTWLACVGLCLVGCDLGCCFIPFCVDAMKDVDHHCPNCHVQVGSYHRI